MAVSKSEIHTKIKLADSEEIDLKDFFYAHYPIFSSFAMKYISDSDLCEDIVQDIFLKFWEKRQSFSDIYSVKAFFYKSIRNSCLDYIKHEKVKDKYIKQSLHLKEIDQSFWDEIIKKEAYSIVYEEINKLPEMGKEVLLLTLSGKNNEEIAQELGIAVNTVKTHKSRAYKVLRKNLEGLLFFILLVDRPLYGKVNLL